VSIAFARPGADVALVVAAGSPSRRLRRAWRRPDRKAVVLPVDVREDDAVRTAVAATGEQIGPASIAVANAGTNGWAEIEEQTTDLVRNALEVNVEGVANLIRATVPSMRERRFGKVLVVSSDNGRRPEAGGSAYVASKFGAVGLSLSIAQELYADGVGVHVIEPDASTPTGTRRTRRRRATGCCPPTTSRTSRCSSPRFLRVSSWKS
jgi:NAD(P)-dependent dehydrogenase (short-subunit alcohol dehydrogenase family)